MNPEHGLTGANEARPAGVVLHVLPHVVLLLWGFVAAGILDVALLPPSVLDVNNMNVQSGQSTSSQRIKQSPSALPLPPHTILYTPRLKVY